MHVKTINSRWKGWRTRVMPLAYLSNRNSRCSRQTQQKRAITILLFLYLWPIQRLLVLYTLEYSARTMLILLHIGLCLSYSSSSLHRIFTHCIWPALIRVSSSLFFRYCTNRTCAENQYAEKDLLTHAKSSQYWFRIDMCAFHRRKFRKSFLFYA